MNINDRVVSVEEFWRGWSSTEALIVILLVVITFLLIQLNSGRRKKPAFTKKEWDEAVAAWYEWEFSQPYAMAPGFTPGNLLHTKKLNTVEMHLIHYGRCLGLTLKKTINLLLA